MARLSNAQGLLFAEISTEEVSLQGQPVATLKGWFGAQQVGQIKSLVTNTVNEQKGVVTHTVGDSILSSFADANATLAAALAIQRRVAKAQNPATGMIVKVRIGLAYGPVRVFAGKVSGDSVTAAGILLEKAQPNEILADQAMLDAVGSAKETRFEACGVIEGVTAYRVVSLTPAPAPAPRPGAEGDNTMGGATMPGLMPIRKPAAEAVVADPPAAPGATSASAITLTFAGAERRFTPADGEIFIGRGKDVHITVPEIHVSRKHAKIVWEEGGIPYLVNLSQNGTCVRYASTGREHTCMARIPLQGGGDIALCSRFGQVSSPAEIIGFSLLAK
jgi:adenylate cyclase